MVFNVIYRKIVMVKEWLVFKKCLGVRIVLGFV